MANKMEKNAPEKRSHTKEALGVVYAVQYGKDQIEKNLPLAVD